MKTITLTQRNDGMWCVFETDYDKIEVGEVFLHRMVKSMVDASEGECIQDGKIQIKLPLHIAEELIPILRAEDNEGEYTVKPIEEI